MSVAGKNVPFIFFTHPSLLTIGCKVTGSMSTLPLGTLAISVTAQTTPLDASGDCAKDGSGV
jgi:hypothetical protein